MLALVAEYNVPLTLAVIPLLTGPALAARLQGLAVEVAPHGWSHLDHAAPGRKSCELGPERPAPVVLFELATGLARLRHLHGDRTLPVLVPPWNRIDPALMPSLAELGFDAVSAFGPEPDAACLTHLNAHVDLIDWHGSRGGRDTAALVADLVRWLTVARETGQSVGVMTHHLVHDAAAWSFIERLFALTASHPGAAWHRLSDLLSPADQTAVA